MPIVKPDAELHSPALQKLAELFNETLGFCPNSVLTMQKKTGTCRSLCKLEYSCNAK